MRASPPARLRSGPSTRALAGLADLERRARRAVRAGLEAGPRAAFAAFAARAPAGPASGAPPRGAPALLLPAVGWEYRFQRPQQLARAFAAAGRPLLYLDPFARTRLGPRRAVRPLGGGLDQLRLRLPGRPDPYRTGLTRDAAAALADWLLARLPASPAWILVQLPFWLELGLALRERCGAPLVYDCLDHHAAFAAIPPLVGELEERLFAAADLVVATSGELAARAGLRARRVEIVRNGVASEEFRAAPPAPAPRRRVGFVGALAGWVDAEAVALAAHSRPELRFTLAGRVEDPAFTPLSRLANVHLPGEIPYAAVPAFLAAQDLVLVPFRNTPLTRAVDPVKLYEALAVGVPVVARRLPETARWAAQVALYDDPAALPALLDRELAADDEARRAARRAAVAAESWAARAAAIERLVAGLIGSGSR